MSRSDRTEKPTPKRKREARRKGEVARSPEVAVAFSLVGAVISFRVFGPNAAAVISERASAIFSKSALGISAAEVQGHVAAMVLAGAVPFVSIALVLGFSAGALQVGFRLAPEAAKPKLSNLNPKRGLDKFKPGKASWELAKTLVKLGLLLALTWGPLTDWVTESVTTRRLGAALEGTGSQAWNLIIRAAVLGLVIGAADYAFTRYRTGKQLKMTKEEVKREHKDTEGDPLLRGQRKRRAMDISRNRMIRMVGTADVVVTNPTHLAIALSYDADEGAPRVLAKGADKLAARIRSEAYRNGVPVIENKPLARSLYRKTKVGGFVPASLYEAVAVVLALAFRRTGKVPA